MTRAYLGLGSNLGDRRALLEGCIEALDWGECTVVERSPIYETDPVGGPPDQPPFLNMVVGVDTTLSARGLFERCEGVEAALGRGRLDEVHWGPRAIDVDLLLFGDEVVDEPDLTVPHPRLRERAFVLVPLAQIASDAIIPGAGTVSEVLRALGDAGGVRVLP